MYENPIIPLIFRSNDKQLFYEFVLNGQSASVEYRFEDKNQLMLMNIIKSKYLDDKVTMALIERIMEHARRMEYEVFTQCPLIIEHLKNNRQLQKSIRVNTILANTDNSTTN